MKKIKNWAGTVRFETDEIHYPSSEKEIIEIVKKCNQINRPLKVMGKQHSYNSIFQPGPGGMLISLKNFNAIEKVDKENCLVTFQAGATTPQLLKSLQNEGLTLSNLGTNIMDNFAGACSTGYHGSGIRYGIQSTTIVSMEFIAGNGEKMVVGSEDPLFKSIGVGLGAFGIIIRLTIRCEPAFNLHMVSWKTTLPEIEKNFPALLNENDHFKFMWTPHTETFQVWTANRTKSQDKSYWKINKTLIIDGLLTNNAFHEMLLYPAYFYPNFTKSVNRLMEKMLIPERGELTFTSYWVFFLPHVMKQTAMEYAFAIEDTFPFIYRLMDMIKERNFIVQTPVEVRFVKKDEFWMSPAYERDSCYIGTKTHLVRGLKHLAYDDYFQKFTDLAQDFKSRPHWGKPLYMHSDYLASVYPKWKEFWALVETLDPHGLLMNAFLQKVRGEPALISQTPPTETQK